MTAVSGGGGQVPGDVVARTYRQYVPAYQAQNGNIIPIGSTTASAYFAEQEAETLRSADDETEVFVAYRDQPVWTRLPPPAPQCSGCGGSGEPHTCLRDPR